MTQTSLQFLFFITYHNLFCFSNGARVQLSAEEKWIHKCPDKGQNIWIWLSAHLIPVSQGNMSNWAMVLTYCQPLNPLCAVFQFALAMRKGKCSPQCRMIFWRSYALSSFSLSLKKKKKRLQLLNLLGAALLAMHSTWYTLVGNFNKDIFCGSVLRIIFKICVTGL